MAPSRPTGVNPRPEDFLEKGRSTVERTANNCWFPVYCALVMAGVSDSRILEIRGTLMIVYQRSGIRGLATTIKRWGKAVRVILEDNPRTRSRNGQHQTGYAKSMKNWTAFINARGLADRASRIDMVKAQGEREIPPFLLDRTLIGALRTNPSRDLLERLVILSNLGRTQPSPDREEVVKGLRAFKRLIETPRRHNLRVRAFVQKCFSTFRGKGVTSHTHWSFTGHASLEYSRGMGGKTREVIDKVLDDFIKRPITTLVNSKPPEPLVDLTGLTVINPEDWDPTKKIGEVVYPSLVRVRENSADARLGHIGLLWALTTLQAEGSLALESNEFRPGLFLMSQPPQYSVVWCRLMSRVEGLAEEGWKCRVITITSMAATVLGHVARHMLDPILLTDPLIRIGLRDKVKLWSLLRHLKIPPEVADSVDLTTATDAPTREIVQDVLHGILDGVNHPHDKFLRMAAEVACSDREFSGEMPPTEHRRGIMMGEPLSGIFLNGMSYAVRSLARPLANEYPELLKADWSNQQCDDWIAANEGRIQEFLDRANPGDDRLSSQSGDDMIIFTNSGFGAVLRVCYRIFECIPSETTWYTSKRYALFTEEAALNIPDGKGWVFVDSVKPRTFVPTKSDPDTVPILGKISLLTSYLRYIVEDHGPQDRRFRDAVRLVDLMVKRDPRVWKPIHLDNLAVGLPRSLGGILHPIGLEPGYVASLNGDIQAGIWDYLAQPDLQLLRQEFLSEDSDRGVDPDLLERLVSGFFEHIELYELKTYEDIQESLPEEERGFTYKVRQKAKSLEYVSLADSLNEIVRNCTFLAMVQGEQAKRARPMRQVRNRAEAMRLRGGRTLPSREQVQWNSTDISKFLQSKRNNLFIPRTSLKEFFEGMDMPSLMVTFVTIR